MKKKGFFKHIVCLLRGHVFTVGDKERVCARCGVEEIMCEICLGEGVLSAICSLCKGSGKTEVTVGWVEHHSGYSGIGDGYDDPVTEERTCDRCRGRGHEICRTCKGNGWVKKLSQ